MRTKRVWILGDKLRVVERLLPGLVENGGPRAATALMRSMLPPTPAPPPEPPTLASEYSLEHPPEWLR